MGTTEMRDESRLLTCTVTYNPIGNITNVFGKEKRKCKGLKMPEYAYWKNLLLRHNLDLMHVEKESVRQSGGI